MHPVCSACGSFSRCSSLTQLGPVAAWDPRSCPLDASKASTQPPSSAMALRGPDPSSPPWRFHLSSVAEALTPALGAQASARPAGRLAGGTRAPYCLSLPVSPAPPHPKDLSLLCLCFLPLPQTQPAFPAGCPSSGQSYLLLVKGLPDPGLVRRGQRSGTLSPLHRHLAPCQNVSVLPPGEAPWKLPFELTPAPLLRPLLRASFSLGPTGPLCRAGRPVTSLGFRVPACCPRSFQVDPLGRRQWFQQSPFLFL